LKRQHETKKKIYFNDSREKTITSITEKITEDACKIKRANQASTVSGTIEQNEDSMKTENLILNRTNAVNNIFNTLRTLQPETPQRTIKQKEDIKLHGINKILQRYSIASIAVRELNRLNKIYKFSKLDLESLFLHHQNIRQYLVKDADCLMNSTLLLARYKSALEA
jgi:hypothetical protein